MVWLNDGFKMAVIGTHTLIRQYVILLDLAKNGNPHVSTIKFDFTTESALTRIELYKDEDLAVTAYHGVMTMNPNWSDEQKIFLDDCLTINKTNRYHFTKTNMTEDLKVQEAIFCSDEQLQRVFAVDIDDTEWVWALSNKNIL